MGNIANAVLAALSEGGYEGLTAYTEVIQDGMLNLIRNGVIKMASATSFSLSAAGVKEFNDNIDFYRTRILLRTQEISNHPELIRRLGVIAARTLTTAPCSRITTTAPGERATASTPPTSSPSPSPGTTGLSKPAACTCRFGPFDSCDGSPSL